ncbi:WD40/YVTN/BNR-like repeat-containing protein [Halococcus qingdaonensis]|uniref:WD40/YVTN/BNR-like repeat-containing protein n=1 Tax=Halococcus qingdaonensis TaxID=224402 RepID=UPI0021164A88|nr:YCF48-related protein [Halococcus qingdaonensis]
MADSSAGGSGFFAYYRQYARSGVHAASAAALTAIGLWASFTGNRSFILLAIAVYVLPPLFLYLTNEGERVPSVVDEDVPTDHGADRSEASTGETRDSSDSDDDHDPRDGRVDRSQADATAERRTTDDSSALDTSGAASATDEHDGEERIDDGADESASGSDDSERDGNDRDGDESAEPDWTESDTPTDRSLLDVVATHESAYAVGEGGIVLARDEDEWTVALDDGPTANGNVLRGVDATDDGEAIWFAGDSGVLGRYADGTLTDHSAPKDQTSTWEDVAVTGELGGERLYLVNGSGELLRGSYEGGTVSWEDIEKPGSGSSISSIAFVDGDRGHLCDTNQSVYETTDGGESFERIGIEDANAAFIDIAANAAETLVTADDGSLFRHDGAVWTRRRPGEAALSAIAIDDEAGFAAGDGGAMYERANGDWESVETPVAADLRGIAVGDQRAVAVGAEGTIVER